MTRLSRRQWLVCAAASSVSLSGFPRGRETLAAETSEPPFPIPPCDVKIDRVVGFATAYQRPRIVGGNAKYRVAGQDRTEDLVAVFGNNGMVGVGALRGRDAKAVLGKTVAQALADWRSTHLAPGTSAVWDLAAKSENKPLYALLGGAVPEGGVPVYDGTIYMEEQVSHYGPPTHPGRNDSWKTPFARAIEVTREHGHNFIKVKIGRGSIHLARQAGNYQDLAVLEYLRELAGPDFGIAVDANDGYTLADTKWLLEQTKSLNLAWIEEMFPEDMDLYRELTDFLREGDYTPVIADGENWSGIDDAHARRFIQSGLIRLLQGNIHRFGLEGSALAALLGKPLGCQIVPHSWGSLLGLILQVQLGCVVKNFRIAEQDILAPVGATKEALVIEPYVILNGKCTPPDAPGIGITLNRTAFDKMDFRFDERA
jgi:L-alanine-DL-glutamate epimerase-like enolase superfamily enzyme